MLRYVLSLFRRSMAVFVSVQRRDTSFANTFRDLMSYIGPKSGRTLHNFEYWTSWLIGLYAVEMTEYNEPSGQILMF